MLHFVSNFALFTKDFKAKTNVPSRLRALDARNFKSICLCKICMKKFRILLKVNFPQSQRSKTNEICLCVR